MSFAAERAAVEDASQVSPARTLAGRLARHAGFAQPDVDRIELVVTELASNLVRHAVGGELLFLPVGPAGAALTVVAVDRGPGVQRFEQCFADGYSTSGTMGTGLGAVRRLADGCDASSEPEVGTVVAASFTAQPRRGGDADGFDVGVVGFPIGGEVFNGDVFGFVRRGSRVVTLLSDGLGHGVGAHAASTAAVAELPGLADLAPAPLLTEVSRRIAGTRGAAVTVAGLDLDSARGGGQLVSAGLGNVSILVAGADGTTRRVATSHGTAGARTGVRPTERVSAFPAGGVLVLHSDGLTSRWTLDGRAELLRHTATVIAAALWRDHARGTDDTLVAVVKAAGSGGNDVT